MGCFRLLPFIILSGLLPWANGRVFLIFTLGWVTPCKLLLLCLANFVIDWPAWTLSHVSHFLLAFLLPVRIKAGIMSEKASGRTLRAHIPTLLLQVGALLCCYTFYELAHPPFTHLFHFLALYLVLDFPHRIASMALSVLFGLETLPIFCKPWLATSLTDFWGRRWDLTASALLRHIVYNPVINLFTSSSPQQSAAYSVAVSPPATKPLSLSVRLIGVNATFLVSGLLHELLYFTVSQGVVPTWEVTAFFIVHGVASSAEITMRRACPKHATIFIRKMPRPLKAMLTMGFMYATMTCLFFPQLVRAGIILECASEFNAIFNIHELVSAGGGSVYLARPPPEASIPLPPNASS